MYIYIRFIRFIYILNDDYLYIYIYNDKIKFFNICISRIL